MRAFAERLGDNIRRARKRAGLSQEDTSLRASLHRTAVGQLERGERVARADTLVKLAAALEVPVGDFFEGLTWQPGYVEVGRFVAVDPDDTKSSDSKGPETPWVEGQQAPITPVSREGPILLRGLSAIPWTSPQHQPLTPDTL